MKKYWLFMALVFATLAIGVWPAFAQDDTELDPDTKDWGLNVQLFRPSIFGGSFISFDDGRTLGTLGFHAGALVNYTDSLLTDYEDGEPNFDYISDLFTGDLMLGFGTWDFLSIGVDVPVHYVNHLDLKDFHDIDNPVYDAQLKDKDPQWEWLMGDIRAALKFGLLKQEKHWINWALTPYVIFDTGNVDAFLGEGRTTGGGSMTFDHDFGIFVLGVNGGYLYRDKAEVFETEVGDAAKWAAGIAKDWDNGFGLSLEYTGQYFFVDDTDNIRNVSQEFLGTLRYRFGGTGPRMIAGAGPGAAQGVGTPVYRAIAGLDYTYTKPEPTKGDLKVRVIDSTGAPLTATLKVTGPDGKTKTIDTTGEWNASLKAGTYDLAASADGYVAATGSALVVVNEAAEAVLQLAAVAKPAPPVVLTIKVVDKETGALLGSTLYFDRGTPAEKETDNPTGSIEGAWQAGSHTLMIRAKGHETLCTQIAIDPTTSATFTYELRTKLEKKGEILFKVASAELRPESYPILDDVVKQINELCEYNGIVIEGHTSSEGTDAYNMKLSQARAESVRKYLVSKGIPADKLTVEAFGETKPIADNSTEDGRRQNRRVEFIIQ